MGSNNETQAQETTMSQINTNVVAYGRKTVQVARRCGGVLLVAINRPDVLNALSDDGTNAE
jgi:hypothetical protein